MTPYEHGVARAIADRENAITDLTEVLADLEAKKGAHPGDIVRARAALEQLRQARASDPDVAPIRASRPIALGPDPTELARRHIRQARAS